MGQRTLEIHSDVLTSIFKGGRHPAYEVSRDALPDDAWIACVEHLNIGINRYPGVVRLTLESAEWPALKPGEAIPSITPYIRLANPADYHAAPDPVGQTPVPGGLIGSAGVRVTSTSHRTRVSPS